MLTDAQKHELDTFLQCYDIERIHIGLYKADVNGYPGKIEVGINGIVEWPPLVILGILETSGNYITHIMGYLTQEHLEAIAEYIAPYQSGGKYNDINP